MRIAIISKLWERTDPFSTGGTGALVGNLAEGLIKKGHQVTLFATGDSKTSAKLVAVLKKPFSEKKPYSEIYEYLNIATAFNLDQKFDLISCHVDHKTLIFSNITKTPVIHTLDYGEFFEDEIELLKLHKNQSFITVSKAMEQKLNFLNIKAVIPNSIDCQLFPFNNSPKNYYLFLARLSPQKGPDLAIKAALRSGVKLILAGKTNLTDQTYLKNKVYPFIDGKQIKYIGEAKFKEKINLLKNARALIHPHSCFEAFGISMLEAQACGTPVIAYPNGAAGEVVDSGKTGFIVNSVEEMVRAIKKIQTIHRLDCRQRVETNFSSEQMVERYEKIFKSMIK